MVRWFAWLPLAMATTMSEWKSYYARAVHVKVSSLPHFRFLKKFAHILRKYFNRRAIELGAALHHAVQTQAEDSDDDGGDDEEPVAAAAAGEAGADGILAEDDPDVRPGSAESSRSSVPSTARSAGSDQSSSSSRPSTVGDIPAREPTVLAALAP